MAVKDTQKDGGQAGSDENTARNVLFAEVELLRSLDHPYLPKVTALKNTEDEFYVVMDFVEGNSLAKVITDLNMSALSTTDDPILFPVDDVIRVGKQLCNVIKYLHDPDEHEGGALIHRDIKPGNVMLLPAKETPEKPYSGDIRLVDFGTARLTQNSNHTQNIGTNGYAPPEQREMTKDSKPSERSDIFAFGRTLFHLATGEHPIDHLNAGERELCPIRSVEPKSISNEHPSYKKRLKAIRNLPEGLEEIIAKCTQEKMNERYHTIQEVAVDLENVYELGAKNRRDRTRKITTTIVSFCLAILFCAGGMWSHHLSIAKQSQSYESLVERANTQMENGKPLSYDEVIDTYLNAIRVDPTRADAYALSKTDNNSETGLIIFMCRNAKEGTEEGTEEGTLKKYFSEEDRQVIEGLLSELAENHPFPGVKKPLAALKSMNEDAYKFFCGKVGEAYWHYFKDAGTDRSREWAMKWFREKDHSSVYVQLGDAYIALDDARAKNDGESIEASFQEIFHQFQALDQRVKKEDKIYMLIIAYEEMVKMIDDNTKAFLGALKNTDNDLLAFLQSIQTTLESKKENLDSGSVTDKSATDLLAQLTSVIENVKTQPTQAERGTSE